MKIFDVVYEVEFVSGLLKGIKTEKVMSFPISSKSREKAWFKKAVRKETVIKGLMGTSDYVVKSFRFENERVSKFGDYVAE